MKHLACVLLLQTAALAAPARRFAVVVGSNRGDADDQPLRYAEADAHRVTRVLHELGGFQKGDLVELDTPDAGAVAQALTDLSARVAAEAAAGRTPLLVFYYSGHADADSLHTAGTRITFDALRSWLRDSRAAVRVAVVDSCRSGALTRVKGMHAAPAIDLNLANEITTRGEALLTSSTSDELARESDALRGSFFTHHLVSGLRGAADQSKDGRVTLAEAYEYAYGKTVAQAAGGQHPTFKYDLAGRGDVILTSLSDGGAWLSFAEGTSGLYLIFGEDGALLGDVDVGKSPLKIGVAPGRYVIRKHDREIHIVLGHGEERWIHDEELQPAPLLTGPPKGVIPQELPQPDSLSPVVILPAPEPPAAPPQQTLVVQDHDDEPIAKPKKSRRRTLAITLGVIGGVVVGAVALGLGLGLSDVGKNHYVDEPSFTVGVK